jgi:hypothetical protein
MKENTALCILMSIVCLLSVALGWELSENRHRRIETCKNEFESTGKEWTQMDLFNCIYDKTGGILPNCDFDWRQNVNNKY